MKCYWVGQERGPPFHLSEGARSSLADASCTRAKFLHVLTFPTSLANFMLPDMPHPDPFRLDDCGHCILFLCRALQTLNKNAKRSSLSSAEDMLPCGRELMNAKGSCLSVGRGTNNLRPTALIACLDPLEIMTHVGIVGAVAHVVTDMARTPCPVILFTHHTYVALDNVSGTSFLLPATLRDKALF